MKRLFLATTVCVLSVLCLDAQVRDITFSVGTTVPMYKGIDADMTLGLDYGRFFWSGLGFRTGLRYTPSLAEVDNHFGLPVAIAYRTRARSPRERLGSGAWGAAESAGWGGLYGEDPGDVFKDAAAGFLLSLFRDMEFYAGVTPGFVTGSSGSLSESYSGPFWEKEWTEKRSPLSLTVDAGMTLNYQIWRFDLKLMPAFHYNVVRTLVACTSRGAEEVGERYSGEQPIRWFFSFGGGLAFRF